MHCGRLVHGTQLLAHALCALCVQATFHPDTYTPIVRTYHPYYSPPPDAHVRAASFLRQPL
jgi:hypothetical protein